MTEDDEQSLAELASSLREAAGRLKMAMWTVYDHPSDFPDGYVVRLWETWPEPRATGTGMSAADVAPMRLALQRAGFQRLERRPEDEPQILETWL